MAGIDLNPLILTFKLAFITALLLFIICLPLAYWLAYSRFKLKPVVEAIVSLPLVLPPSVLGFYLLLAFSPGNAFGKFLEHYLNLRLVFSFPGIVIGSLLYSLPFMVHPLQSGFKNIQLSLKRSFLYFGQIKVGYIDKNIITEYARLVTYWFSTDLCAYHR